jgi:hypothetical protein
MSIPTPNVTCTGCGRWPPLYGWSQLHSLQAAAMTHVMASRDPPFRAASTALDLPTGEIGFAVQSPVRHAEWGDGTVMREEDDRLTVLFDQEGATGPFP